MTTISSTTSTLPVFIVTGASRGYGHAIVEELFKLQPCRILGTARSENQLIELQSLYGSVNFQFVVGDITETSVIQRIVNKTIETWGKIDGIVHNAGVIEPMGSMASLKIQDIKHLFNVNLFSVIELTQWALPYLRKAEGQGKLIFISSGAATKAYPSWSPYCLSKVALNMLAQCIHEEEGKNDIIAIALRPGVLDTSMQQWIREKGSACLPSSMHTFFMNLYEKGKLTHPNHSACIVAHLCFEAKKEWSGLFLDWEDPRFHLWKTDFSTDHPPSHPY
ncbi:hypothetical protein HMI54_007860 [Coelomomyces lativittatus]|nr:hypothetical protein HMI55_002156 [Coelomomyces lativittatus]KAJ1512392.1 hypothetical protein HMI56_004124 [Coelomomyces lativittatus]KAJ1516879.1 hypothetical protein HMI54_007860 [Coelomomyces lativittatus]